MVGALLGALEVPAVRADLQRADDRVGPACQRQTGEVREQAEQGSLTGQGGGLLPRVETRSVPSAPHIVRAQLGRELLGLDGEVLWALQPRVPHLHRDRSRYGFGRLWQIESDLAVESEAILAAG